MKKKIIIIVVVAIIAILACAGVYIAKIKPLNDAKKEYNNVIEPINQKNNELDGKINQLQKIIDSGEKPIDETLIDTSKEAIKEAQKNKFLIEKTPQKVEDIKKKTEEIKNTNVDYSVYIAKLDEEYAKLSKSIEDYKKFINPTAEFIITKLANVDEIKNSEAVTEDNDPNGKLNKAGGYTATVYFESSNVNQANVYGNSVVEKGTACGGSIEVYSNEEDANKRRDYLSSFDGSVLSNGTHRVIGTTLIRCSDELTATQQKELEQKIINAMIN